ncbi:hypothetical protein M758_UG286400 [Ceratodon purpureus]|nr:hypothetical protein M758_UG286400 [Ceratodon purpureus]
MQPRRGGMCLVGVVADDDAGEEVVESDGDAEDEGDLGNDEEFNGSDDEDEEGSVEVRDVDILVSDDEEEGGRGNPFVGKNLVELRREELDELDSDREFEISPMVKKTSKQGRRRQSTIVRTGRK